MDYKTPVKKILIAAVVFLSVLLVVLAAPNPIGDWRFEEGSGTTTADSSGNGKTGTLINGASWTTSGKVGKAVNFDGANDRISLPSNSAPVQMTVIAWIYPRNLGGGNAGNIFAIRSTSQANTFLAVNSVNKLRFVSTFNNAGVNKIGSWYTPTSSITLNAWQQVAVTYNASNPSNDPVFYINGQQVSTVDNVQPSGVFKTGATPWSIGNNPGLNNGFNGFIDEVRVYNQILSPADILSIYNADMSGGQQDTTSPTVSITSPLNTSTVGGNVSVTANANDNVGVVGVQFKIDGVNLGAEDTSAPYSTTWNTKLKSNSVHVVTAVARDAAGNTANASSTVIVYNQNITNVVYCNNSANNNYNLMDIYYPAQNAPKPLPVVLYIHGGGWQAGIKEDIRPQPLAELLSRGYLVASINYRLAPGDIFPEFVEDSKCAVRYLRSNAGYYGANGSSIGAWGESAGGHLVSMLGTLDEGTYEGTGGWAGQSSRVQAVADLFGPADLSLSEWSAYAGYPTIENAFGAYPGTGAQVLVDGSPVHYITPDDPPFFILHGTADQAVPPTQSQYMHDNLTAVGVPSQLFMLQGFAHGGQNLWDDPVYGPQMQEELGDFFDAKLKYYGGDTTPPFMTNPIPWGALHNGTTIATLSITTDELSTCKYSTIDEPYQAMPITFSTTGGTSHLSLVTGLVDGQSYIYYVRCMDYYLNENTASAVINFSVNSPSGGTGQPPSLLASYGFSEGSGSTTTDSSSYGRTGTLQTGAAWVATGHTGNAVNFDGVNSAVTVADFSPPQSITLESWIYPTVVAGKDRFIISKTLGEYELRILANGRFQAGFGTVVLRDFGVNFTNTASLNQWYHYAYTYDAATDQANLYRNGALVNSTVKVASPIDTTNPFTIGRHPILAEAFSGKIDDVRVWDYARSQTEVQTDMNTAA